MSGLDHDAYRKLGREAGTSLAAAERDHVPVRSNRGNDAGGQPAPKEVAALKKQAREHGTDLADRTFAMLQDGVTEDFVDELSAGDRRKILHVSDGLRREGFGPALARKYELAALRAYGRRIAQHLLTVRLGSSSRPSTERRSRPWSQ